MELLEKELGQKLSVSQVADYLGLDEKFVRRQYIQLGGVRLGTRRYIFFERRLIDALHEQTKQQQQVSVDRTSEDQRAEEAEVMHNQKTGARVGGRAKKAKSIIDEHGLFS